MLKKKLWLAEHSNTVKTSRNESSSWTNTLVLCTMCHDKKIVLAKGKRRHLPNPILKYNQLSKTPVLYCDANHAWWWIVTGIQFKYTSLAMAKINQKDLNREILISLCFLRDKAIFCNLRVKKLRNSDFSANHTTVLLL